MFHASGRLLGVLFSALLLGGCTSYVTPGGPANFRAMGITKGQADASTEVDIQSRMAARPAASFPAAIVVARVQDRGYACATARGLGDGRFSVVTVRDVEQDTDVQRLVSLPSVREIGYLNRLALPGSLNDARDVRLAAATMQSDIVLLYTFDTTFSGDTTIPALGVISLGLFPNEVQRATSTCSAAFFDTRTGFIYAMCDATAKNQRLHNAWNSREALDNARSRAERDAFAAVVVQMEETWKGIVARYGPPAATP